MMRHHMVSCGDRVVVAVSGGPDSVCLLDILQQLRPVLEVTLVVAHLNHGLRPDVDQQETRFVASLAAGYHLPFFTEAVAAGFRPGEASLEEKAREARYRFLESVRRQSRAHKIALGHSLDDQAETVLMRLLRGSGPSGLSGIPPVRDGTVIRPLIEFTRREVLNYLEKRSLRFMTDASNTDPTYLRNRIRLDIMPRLQAIQPKVVARLGQTADIMRAEKTYLEQTANQWLDKTAGRSQDGAVRFDLTDFRMLPEALKRQVIRAAIRRSGGTLRRLGMRHIRAVEALARTTNPHARAALPHKMTVKRCYGHLQFTLKGPEGHRDFSHRIDGPGQWDMDIPAGRLMMASVGRDSMSTMPPSPWTAYLNQALIRYPLIFRNVRPGDRFVPLGMGGHKKVKDFFIDLKIPLEKRSRIPILVQGDHILWICGYRLDDRFKVTPTTKDVLRVTFDPSDPLF